MYLDAEFEDLNIHRAIRLLNLPSHSTKLVGNFKYHHHDEILRSVIRVYDEVRNKRLFHHTTTMNKLPRYLVPL